MNKNESNRYIYKLRRFIDFCVCLVFFPSEIKVIRFLKSRGQNTIAEKFLLYIFSKNISVNGDILEIGSFMGSSSLLLAAGNELSKIKSKIWLVEPYPKPSKDEFLKVFKSYGFDRNIELIDKTSEEASKIISPKLRFLFIDGDHRYEYVKKDILLWHNCLNEGGMIAFHDYKWEGIWKAINELILESNKYTIFGTMSGILYFLKGDICNDGLILRLKKLNNIRESLISSAKKFGLGE